MMANGEMRAYGGGWSGGAAREDERKRTEEEGGRRGDEEEPWQFQAYMIYKYSPSHRR